MKTAADKTFSLTKGLELSVILHDLQLRMEFDTEDSNLSTYKTSFC